MSPPLSTSPENASDHQQHDDRGVDHGPVRDLPPFGLSFLAFFDPDGIALELTSPISDPG
jgi:hypothetical protein